MTVHIKDGSGNLKEVIGLYIKRNDALEEVLSGYVRQDAVAKQFYSSGPAPAALSVSPSSFVNNYGEFDPAVTQTFTASASFGTGPWTFVWDFVSANSGPGYTGAPTILSGQNTNSITLEFDGNTDAILRVTATDSLSQELTATATLLVHFGPVP